MTPTFCCCGQRAESHIPIKRTVGSTREQPPPGRVCSLIERLDESRYRFTSFDLLGCGASGSADVWKRCTIDEYGADLTGLCDMLNTDRPVVIGHSLGTAAILSAALTRPGRFAGAVLIAPASTTGLDFLPDEASFEALAYPTREQQRTLARAAFRRPVCAETQELDDRGDVRVHRLPGARAARRGRLGLQPRL